MQVTLIILIKPLKAEACSCFHVLCTKYNISLRLYLLYLHTFCATGRVVCSYSNLVCTEWRESHVTPEATFNPLAPEFSLKF